LLASVLRPEERRGGATSAPTERRAPRGRVGRVQKKAGLGLSDRAPVLVLLLPLSSLERQHPRCPRARPRSVPARVMLLLAREGDPSRA
jgi:hypothetical protein